MIRHSFIFLDKINSKTEQNLWNQGITDWGRFLNTKFIRGISKKRKLYYDMQLLKAQKALYFQDSRYFSSMPSTETWRLYEFFKSEAVFLDIETSGLMKQDYVTVIGLFDGICTKTMVNSINLNLDVLKKELARYKLIVTFNGSSFDLPFLKKRYPDLLPQIPHFDLRHACARIGLAGGLKKIEKDLGIKRKNKIVEEMYGGDAASLWRMFLGSGDDYYLNLLVEYNEEDVINLKQIADYVVGELKCRHSKS